MTTEAASSAGVMVPGGVRVMVVDDDPLARRQTGVALQRAGFEVITADDGAIAMVLASATPTDLALVDLEMPTSGLDVVRHLKVLYGQAVHVTVLTGHDDEHSRSAAFEAGADDYVVKPAPVSELRRRMIAAARSQQAYVDARLAREVADRRMAYGAEASALLAHDLNNGLAVALSNLEFLADVLGSGDEAPQPVITRDERDAVASTLRSLRKMSGLVANFVDLGRFEDAAIKLVRTPVAIEELFKSVIEVHAPSLPKGVSCDISVVPPGLTVGLDGVLIERVLHNLVGNAVRYCKAPGWIRLGASRWREQDPGSVELTVQNNGPDIPEEISKTLFEKYVTGRGGKRGMGLYFCRLACEAHGGSVEHVAVPGGPCFVIRLPGAQP
jgi:signal transduction histidine kinase